MAESTAESLAEFKQKFDDQLKCAVCLDQYTNPKTLPCHHSFCLECIRRLPLDRKGDRYCLNCPTCRVEHPLPEGGADEFPNAFHINSLLELRDDLAKKETHSTSTSSKEREETSTVGDKASICPLHNDPLRVYCETCDRLICRDCTISNEHKKHKYDLIVECYPKHHQQIEGELRQVKSKITDIDTAITDLTNREMAVDEQGERLIMEIHQHAQQLIDIIHESERQLIQQVDTITQHKKEFLAKQKEAAGRVHSQLKTCEELIERNLMEMTQGKVLMEKQAMIERMKKASEHVDPATFVPIEEAKAKYKKYSKFESHQMTGEITEGKTCAKAVLDAPPNRFFSKDKKCSFSLTLQSHDGSPFPVPCSAISCIAHCLTGSTRQTMKYYVSKYWSSGKYNISVVSPSNSVYKLEVLVGGIVVPGNTMLCAVIPIKTIGLKHSFYRIAISDNGNILATDTNRHSISVLDKRGREVRSVGTIGTKEGQFMYPYGLVVTNDGHILVTDLHRLQKLTFDGVCVNSVGSSESGRGQLEFSYPRGIAVHPTTGQIFVADEFNNRVQVLNADLTFSHVITLQDDHQHFQRPCDLSLDNEGYLYVAELGNHCIMKLTTTGQYITGFGSRGSTLEELPHPFSLAIQNNLVYVSELRNRRVSVFNTNGEFIYCIAKRGMEEEFGSLYGVAVDKLCNLYVCAHFGIIVY